MIGVWTPQLIYWSFTQFSVAWPAYLPVRASLHLGPRLNSEEVWSGIITEFHDKDCIVVVILNHLYRLYTIFGMQERNKFVTRIVPFSSFTEETIVTLSKENLLSIWDIKLPYYLLGQNESKYCTYICFQQGHESIHHRRYRCVLSTQSRWISEALDSPLPAEKYIHGHQRSLILDSMIHTIMKGGRMTN